MEVEGPINTYTGFVADYGDLKELVNDHVIRHLDHTHLGYGKAILAKTEAGPVSNLISEFTPYLGENFYPTSENLARAIFKILAPLVKELEKDVRLQEIHIRETCTCEAVYSASDEPASFGAVELPGRYLPGSIFHTK